MPGGNVRKRLDSFTKIRLRLVTYFLLLLMGGLIVRLYFLQVMTGEVYASQAQQSLLRSKSIPAPRGNIYDRNGKLLVKSIPAPAIAIDPSIVSGNEDVINALCEKLNLDKGELQKKIDKSNISYLERIILKQNIDYGTMIYFKENSDKFPGVEIVDVFLREYEYGSLAAHILGYTGEIDEDRLKMSKYSMGYEGGDQIGLTGIEDTYENVLKGSKGKITYEVDPQGKPKDIVEKTQYIPGNDLYLTIDIDLQKAVEEIFANSIDQLRKQKVTGTEDNYKVPGGAVVVLDPANNEVLSMVSFPSYDPSVFTGGISAVNWAYLNDPKNDFPLNNRAIMGYPPGSVFKLITAYAALSEGIVNSSRYITCNGVWTGLGGDFPKWCWAKGGHGALNIFGAIQNSCDIFFYELGYELFLKNKNADELLQKYAKIFGFGKKTGIDLPNEDPGVVPDKAWKKEYFKDQKQNTVWFPGDSVNMAIGQGDVLVSPLQMAEAYSILINRGLDFIPHVGMEVKDANGNAFAELGGKEAVNLELNKEYMGIFEKGMGLVVSSGTAAGRFIGFPLKEIPVAGKTGTAEVAGKQSYAWFVTYAPIEKPKYLIVVMMEQAGGGSVAAAPIAEKIYEYLFNVTKKT